MGKVGRGMYYHGTTKDSAEIIVNTQCVKSSIGNDHWLGDGIYFYINVEYAFRWILIKYTNNFKNEFAKDYENIYDKYSILSASINIRPERLFSMEDINHRLLFIETKMALSKKAEGSKRYSEKVKNKTIVDGVVFNYLFKFEEYGKKYDAVKAVFPISYICDDSRMEYLPEPQICVKNSEIISGYKIHSENKVPKELVEFIDRYNRTKYELRRKKNFNKYKNKPKSIKYQKEV